eukprot:TRINITY_DN1199_c0_g1_i5.p1 TRINITY_DN1199_c0_g1~~TRINITY_DN1199_c0_g1_i5.p1  ORF type:complete len:841 (-),score=132.53 TRINITY_DN1199_c0_g1_i5:1441-3963(-)
MAPRLRADLKHVPIGSCPHDVQCMPFGAQGSSLYRACFVDVEDNKLISPWHDIALHRAEGHMAVVCSTPAGSWVRYELASNEPYNPIRIRKATAGPRGGVACTKIAAHAGKTSHLAHFSDNAPWNHAFFPQTAAACTLHGTAPLQVLEIGAEIQRHTGEVYFVKPLGAIPVEEGQPTLTWKILAIAVDDPMAPVLWDWTDMEVHLPGILDLIKDWLRTALCSEAGEKESIVHIQRPARLSQTLAKIAEYHQTWKHYQAHRSDNSIALLSPAATISTKMLESAWRPHTTKDPYLSIPLHPLSTHVLFDNEWLNDEYFAEEAAQLVTRNALKAPPVSSFQKATKKFLGFFNLSPSAPPSKSSSKSTSARASNNSSKTSSAASSKTFASMSPSPSGRRSGEGRLPAPHPASRNTSFGSNDGSIPSPSPHSPSVPRPLEMRKSHDGFVYTPSNMASSPSAAPRPRSSRSNEGFGQSSPNGRRSSGTEQSEGTDMNHEMENAILAMNKAQEELDALRKKERERLRNLQNEAPLAEAGARVQRSVEGHKKAAPGGNSPRPPTGGGPARTSSLPVSQPESSRGGSDSVPKTGGAPVRMAAARSSSDADVPAVMAYPLSAAPVPVNKMQRQTHSLAPPAAATIDSGADVADGEVDAAPADHTRDHTAVLTALRVAKMHEEKRERHARHHQARHANSPKRKLTITVNSAAPPGNSSMEGAHLAAEKAVTPRSAAIAAHVTNGTVPGGGSGTPAARSASGRLLTPKSASTSARWSPASSKGSKGRRRKAKKVVDSDDSHSESETDSEDERWGGGEGGLKRRIALTRSLSYHEESVPRPAELDMLPKYDSE